MDSSLLNVCNRGGYTRPGLIELPAMPTIPQRIASAFAVLCGRYGDVTRMAQDREQSPNWSSRSPDSAAKCTTCSDAWGVPSR